MLALILVAGARASGELDRSNAMTWLMGAGFAAVLPAVAVLYLRMQARPALALRESDARSASRAARSAVPDRAHQLRFARASAHDHQLARRCRAAPSARVSSR